MISSTTPYKLSEIIRDTWPQLYKYETPKKKISKETKKEKDVYT